MGKRSGKAGLAKALPFRHGEGVDNEMSLPPHWTGDVWPSAWPLEVLDDDQDFPELDLRRVGNVLLPHEFFLVLHAPDMGDDGVVTRGLIVTFEVVDGEIRLVTIHGSGLDVAQWLDYLADHFPVSAWKSYAKSKMAWVLAQDEVRARVPSLSLATSESAQVRTRSAPAQAASGGGARGRTRHRITDTHLKEVSRIYSDAVSAGDPPTRAVADAFEVAHSTAAKWVGAARRNGLLEGVSQKWGTKSP